MTGTATGFRKSSLTVQSFSAHFLSLPSRTGEPSLSSRQQYCLLLVNLSAQEICVKNLISLGKSSRKEAPHCSYFPLSNTSCILLMMIIVQGEIFQESGAGNLYTPPPLATQNKAKPWGLNLKSTPRHQKTSAKTTYE